MESYNCAECIRQHAPNDPRTTWGKYGLCDCDYCNAPTATRIPSEPRRTIPLPDTSKRDYDLATRQIQYLLNEVHYLKNRVNVLSTELAKINRSSDPMTAMTAPKMKGGIVA